jgi:hypothetical protein
MLFRLLHRHHLYLNLDTNFTRRYRIWYCPSTLALEPESDSDSNPDAQSDSDEVVGAILKQQPNRKCKRKVVPDGEDGDIQPKSAKRERKALLTGLESNKKGRKSHSKKSIGATRISGSKKAHSPTTSTPILSYIHPAARS